MAKKSIFSSKKKKGLDITEEDYPLEKKGSFLSKLNKPMFSKAKTSTEDFAFEEDAEEGGLPPQEGGKKGKAFLSFGKKEKGGNTTLTSSKHHQPYTMFGKPLKGNLLAIDFDDDELRLMVAKYKRQELEVTHTFKRTLLEGIVLNGEILDPRGLSDAIDFLLSEHGVSAQYTFFAVNNTDVIVRPVEVPSTVDEADIEGLISFELQQYLDIEPEAYVIEYTPTAAAMAASDEGVLSLMAYAVPKRTVEQYLEVADYLKMTPYTFDLQSNAIEKWMNRVEAINNRAKHLMEQNVGIIHLSKRATDVFLYARGQFVTSNRSERGYARLLEVMDTPSIMQNLAGIATGEISNFLVKDALDEWVLDVSTHILNTENFYSSTTNEVIQNFYIFGDEEVCRYLNPILKSRLARDIEVISTIDCQDIIWGMEAEFSSEFIPATAMLIRRAN